MEDMEAVYRRHAQTVYKFLLSQCHSAQMAEELTQETFYQAVRSIDRFDGSCKVSVWLCQIAKHLWYQHLRKANRETELPEEAELPLVPSAEEEAVGRAGQVELLRQIHSLPEPGREVVYLRAFGGLSFREIGEVLWKSENWARVTFYRSKERLRQGGNDHEERFDLRGGAGPSALLCRGADRAGDQRGGGAPSVGLCGLRAAPS